MTADITVTRMGAWFQGRRFPCSIGRGGIVAAELKREGDGASPSGPMRIVGMLYRADRITAPAAWARPIGPGMLWSDDPLDPDYNHLVHAPHRYRHEQLRRASPVYDLVLITDWNWPHAMSGRGSAIFVHQWRGPRVPTAGCIAFSRRDLRWIAERIVPGTRLLVRG